MVDFDDLTDEQRAAADALDRNVALTAGAGTGKTTTLTARYLRMLERGLDGDGPGDDDAPLLPAEIVTTTFTERAANELRREIRAAITERAADADAETYRRWREVADGLADGYVHTLHGFCNRLLREHALVASGVEPGFDTLDEAETAALLDDTVAGVLETHDDHEIVRTLARLFDRSVLRDVLTDVLSERPGCLDWAERWADATEEEYLEYVNAELHPVPPSLAAEQLGHPQLADAVDELRSLVASPPVGVEPGGNAWGIAEGIVERVAGLDLSSRDATLAKRDRFVSLCSHLTTGGDRYAESYYTAAAGNWGDADEARERFDDAMRTVFAIVEPERHRVDADIEVDRRGVPAVRALARLTLLAHEEYEARKRRRNAVDFTDQVAFALRFVRDEASDDLRRELRRRFAYVLVDEFQDTDPLQWELVKHLTAGDPDDFDADNVCVVGDAKQSIYRFRNADVTQFAETADELRRANLPVPAGAAREDRLSTNFRTLPPVLGFVNALFGEVFEADGPAYEAEPQELEAYRDDPDGLAAVEYLAVPTAADYRARRFGADREFATARVEHDAELEAMALAARLTRLFDEPARVYDPDADVDDPTPRDVVPEDVAVLLRSRTHLKTYERALEDAGVPYTVASGLGFYETPEVTALLNLLRTLADPGDERALYGALRSPLFGLTDDALAMLARDGEPLWDALAAADEPELADAHDLLAEWRAAAGLGPDAEPRLDGSWAAFCSRIIDDTGYLASVGADERSRQAVANVEKFRERLRDLSDGGATGLATLVARLERRRDLGGREGEATVRGGGDGVRILTVHDAKGTEFPVVAVPGVGRGFNAKAAVADGRVEFEEVDGEYAVGLKAPDPDDGFETKSTVAREALKERRLAEERAEEKRVLYVACTRARDRLLLSGTHDLDADGDPTLADLEAADPEAARSWRDWVQPHLLDEATCEALAERDSVTTDVGEATVTVSLPPPPADRNGEGAVPEPRAELSPAPPDPALRFDLSPTDLVQLFDGRGSLRLDERTNTARYEADDAAAREGTGGADEVADADGADDADPDAGFDPTVFGELVHRLCELRPPDGRRDAVMARTFAAEGGEGELPGRARERVREHVDRATDFVDEVHRTCDVEHAYDELRVTAEFDRGEVAGVIDHLVVTPEAYHVIDYKTGDVDPDGVREKAAHYRPQLEAYATALHAQDPEREVQGVLYFTDPDEEHRFWWTPDGLDDLAGELEERIAAEMDALDG